eukprot:CAMPEP_0117588884 /NCGR_PEP_ID=MMETSP0784-20121206/70099_1 /TAXON_ID=39447 /ORGANISM="" /LENGTH=67 /DNA_ID=CAMNT_0005390293 /DNA_START=9 /DNA_END=208 /DNA_ORIENTATION=-
MAGSISSAASQWLAFSKALTRVLKVTTLGVQLRADISTKSQAAQRHCPPPPQAPIAALNVMASSPNA